jgi:hypothetical protein
MNRALLALLVCSFSAVGAQGTPSERSATWGVVVGGDAVTGAYRGGLDEGVVGGLVAQFPLAASHFSLRADLMYHWISDGKSDEVDPVNLGGPGSSGSSRGCRAGIDCAFFGSWSRVVSASFGLLFRVNDPAVRWSPYVVGGAAGYLTGASDEPLVGFRPNHLGFQGGLGFEVTPHEHTYFVEVRYLGMPPGGIVPIVIGVRF